MKKFFYKNISTLLFLFIILASCNAKKLDTKKLKLITQDNETIIVDAEMAITQEQRNYGFMNRKKIPDGTGMLFIFEKDQILSFWMKNTPHPLSIAYIDSTGTIKDIYDMTPFSLSPIVGTCSARYALEVPQGWFKKVNINVGDRLEIDFN